MKIVTDGDSMPMLEDTQQDGTSCLYRVQEFIDGKWVPVSDAKLRAFSIAFYPPNLSGHVPSPY